MDGPRNPGRPSAPADEFTLASGGRFAAAVFLIMLSEQTFLNAGVLLTNATAGAAAAGFVFNILMIARAPLQLFQAVQTSLLPHLTTLGSRGEEKDFRASIRVTLVAIAGFAALVTLAMLIAGPQIMQIAFGKQHSYGRADLVIVAIGMGLYLSAATLNQAALARGQVRRASFCWVGCAIAFLIWNVVPIVDSEATRVVIGLPRRRRPALLTALLALPPAARASGGTASSPGRPRRWSFSSPRRTKPASTGSFGNRRAG